MAGKVATRDAYGEELLRLGGILPDLVVLDADISKSTRTCYFAKEYPDRFFNIGVAEQNEMMIAAGLATCGKIPFVSTYAVFASMRACEQVRTFVCYPRLNVKIAVSHAGLTPGSDGVTHQATEDIGIMRTLPNMTVLMPADSHATKALVQEAANYKGPVYIRLTRDPVPVIYNEQEKFSIGKAKILTEGNDVSLIALGDMLSITLEAQELLKAERITSRVIDMHTVKPIDSEEIIKSARQTGAIVTVENHNIYGGLGSAVAEVLVENFPIPMLRIGLKDTFAESGEYEELLHRYEMDAQAVVKAAKQVIQKKVSLKRMSQDISPKQKLAFLRQMIHIRTFEEKVKVLLGEGLIRGSVHLYIGEEAVAVGICGALKNEDYIVSTHRGHGHCIAKGTDIRLMFAELLGKEAGCCKGKGGSMHIADVSKGILGASGIVGSGIPIAVGAALSSKYLKQGKVVVSFFGDGASNTGTFHECLNLASIWKLPVVFICENNLYAITVPVTKSTSVRDIAVRAVSYSMPSEVVDGSHVLAVFQAARKAVKQAHDGEGPTLIECKTYRYEGHWVGDPICYRPKEEENFWRENRDPIRILKQTLNQEGLLTEDIYETFVKESRAEINQAVDWAKSQSSPAPEAATCDIYSQ